MDGKGRALSWFQIENVIMEVPFFQRPYVWDEEEWEELINSINNANSESMPFIGSFILQKIDKKFYVIDGQQRITTLSVLIKAFLDSFEDLSQSRKQQLFNYIYETRFHGLQDIYIPRLIPSNIDKNDFDAVMRGSQEDIQNKNGKIVQAYKYFHKYFVGNSDDKNREIGIRLLTNKKFFIVIELDEQDDEQKIFDSVNSLGRDLTNSDIIKNYLYQKMKDYVNNDPDMVQQLLQHHQTYWVDTFYSENKRAFWEKSKTLGRIQTNNLEAFLKDFATIKGIYSPSKTGGIDGLAKAYKSFINNLDYDGLKLFSKELSDYAICYYTYTSAYEQMDDFKLSDIVNTTLLVLDKLETTTFNPYVLKVIKSNSGDVEEKLFALQRFIVMRFIYKAKTKNYNNVCESLLNSDDPIQYLNNYNNLESLGLDEYPLGLKKIYNKQATLVLFLLELIRRNGQESKYSGGMKYSLSLEHIMPKSWERHWSDVPSFKYVGGSEEFSQVTEYNALIENRKAQILSIGNMTLLTSSLNSAIGNLPFEAKILGNGKYDGYKKYAGSLSVAKEIIDIYESNKAWDERNIYVRNQKIFSELNDYYKFID